jgi:hypothetical protein
MESANEEEGCADCKEERKNGSYEFEKQEKKRNRCQMLSSNKVMNPDGIGKELMHEGKRDNTNKCCGLDQDDDGRLAPDKGKSRNCCSSRGCDKKFEDNVPDFKRARNKNGCRCCGNDANLPILYEETPHVVDTYETHNEKFDNDDTDTQDRSWIKGEGHADEVTLTVNDDLSTEENDPYKEGYDVTVHQTTTQRQDEKNIRNLNRGTEYEVEIVPNNEIIQTESSPGQTFLPDFFFLPNVRPERDYDLDVEVKTVLPVVSSGVKNDFEGDEDPNRALEFLSLSGCYQITDEGLE